MDIPYFGLPGYYYQMMPCVDKRSFQYICHHLKSHFLSPTTNYVYAFLELYFIAQAPEKKISFLESEFQFVLDYWKNFFPKFRKTDRWSGVDFMNEVYIENMKKVYAALQNGEINGITQEEVEETLKNVKTSVYDAFGDVLGVTFQRKKTTIEYF